MGPRSGGLRTRLDDLLLPDITLSPSNESRHVLRLAVCSWSLLPDSSLGVGALIESIRDTGGVRSDAHWPANLAAARENARIAAELGLPLVTFHAGFIPHEAGELRTKMIGRLQEVVDAFAAQGVGLAFETGQESAETLIEALRELDRPEVGVNFDPANMILYGMGEPIDAVRALASRIAQVHIKDALPTTVPGAWGTEVVAGTGAVDWHRFLGVISALDPGVDLVIEREAGDERVLDVRTAVALVRQTLAELGQEIPK